jgi:drug/metabolite transporter (DMT)-like permease
MHDTAKHHAHGNRHYGLLLLMAVLSFGAMYALMYAMVDRFENVVPNWNQLYMAGLMTAPMVVIELLVMRFMYPSRKMNAIAFGLSLLLGVGCFLAIRRQAGIGDEQFLKSMIPHHASALLMCEEAALTDPEIEALCKKIRAGQQAEIDQMRTILARIGR